MGPRNAVRALALAALGSTLAAPAAAGLYRCPDANPPRFVGDPSACPGARPLEGLREIQTEPAPDPPAAREPAGPAPKATRLPEGSYAGELEPLFVPVRELPGRWEIVREAPTDAGEDPMLASWGVRQTRALHYTRYEGPVSQVCSVELWAFESADRAKAAAAGFARPGWQFLARGNLLVSLRGVTLERGRGARKGLFEACVELGNRTAARVDGQLR